MREVQRFALLPWATGRRVTLNWMPSIVAVFIGSVRLVVLYRIWGVNATLRRGRNRWSMRPRFASDSAASGACRGGARCGRCSDPTARKPWHGGGRDRGGSPQRRCSGGWRRRGRCWSWGGCAWCYCSTDGGRIPSEFRHHLIHLSGVDGGVGPCHVITSHGASAVVHATLEDRPRVVACLTVRHTRLSGVVQEAVVLNPEGCIPGFVVGKSVHGVWFVCLSVS